MRRRRRQPNGTAGQDRKWKRSRPQEKDGVIRSAWSGYEPLVKQNALFEGYYSSNGCFETVEEWQAVLDALRESLPACLRVCRSTPLYTLTLDRLRHFSQTARACTETTSALASSQLAPVPWYPEGVAWQFSELSRVLIKKDARFAQMKQFLVCEDLRGGIVRQEAASMIPPLFMDLKPGHLVLDMCAAPGSKTSQIMELMTCQRSGESEAAGKPPHSILGEAAGGVVANEIAVKRATMLTHQLARFALGNVAVTSFDASVFPSLTSAIDGTPVLFDRVLADVPCSGDGTLRKQPDIWRSWSPSGGLSLHSKQLAILLRGFELLRAGGLLVYSTCSMNPVENEAVIAAALDSLSGVVELIEVDLPEGFRVAPGLLRWKVPDPRCSNTASERGEEDFPMRLYERYDSVPEELRTVLRPTMFSPYSESDASCLKTEGKQYAPPLRNCLRIYPHHNNTGAFFIAVFRKRESSAVESSLVRPVEESVARPDSPTDVQNGMSNAPSASDEEGEEWYEGATEAASEENKPDASPNHKRRGKRRRDPTGLLTHAFCPIDVQDPTIRGAAAFFGLVQDSDTYKGAASELGTEAGTTLENGTLAISADNLDLRQISQWHPGDATSDGADRGVRLAVCHSSTGQEVEVVLPVKSVPGSRGEQARHSVVKLKSAFPLAQLYARVHTPKRLYFVSKQLASVITPVRRR